MQHPHRQSRSRRPGRAPFWGILLAAALCWAPPALADEAPMEDHERAKALLDAGEILPLERVLGMAMRLHPGQPLEVKLTREAEHPGYIYEIQMLDDNGQVWELELDAATGDVVHTQRED
ncbi:MAG: PepSY domain-containing protein [Nitrospirae bacterium]|nr:PepSY domain-containing protein [Nitrospirota bacterium]